MYYRSIEDKVIWFLLFALLTYNALNFIRAFPFLVPVAEGRSDEVDYFTDAKSFYLNNSLHASLSLDESVSKIGESGVHGFGYALYYGSMQKLFGGTDAALVVGNVIALLLSIIFLFKQQYSIHVKVMIALLVLSYFITITYMNTYFVEVLNIALALLLSLLLFNLSAIKEERYFKRSVIFFFLLVIACSAFRFVFVLFLLGLLPLATSGRSFIKYLLLFTAGALFVVLFSSNFIAPTLFHPTKSVVFLLFNGGDNRFSLAKELVFSNLNSFFSHNTSGPDHLYYYKYLFVLFPLLHAYFFFRSGDRSYLIPAIISSAYLLAICPFNNNESDLNDLRPLSAIFILNVVFLSCLHKKFVTYSLVLLALFSFPDINSRVMNDFQVRKQYWQYYSQADAGRYEEIKEYTSDKDVITVQLPGRMSLYDDLYLMPLISREGKPIRYNMTYFEEAPEKSSFITHYFPSK